MSAARNGRNRSAHRLLLGLVWLLLGAGWLRPHTGAGGDPFFYHAMAVGPYCYGSLDVRPLALQGPMALAARLDVLNGATETGATLNMFAPGSAMLHWPAVGGVRLWGFCSGARWLNDGWAAPYRAAVGLGGWAWAMASVLLLYSVAGGILPRRPALAAALLVPLASPLLCYGITEPAHSHAASALAGALVVWLAVGLRRSSTATGGLVIGACIALALWVRPQDVALAIIPVAIWLGTPGTRGRSWMGAALAIGLAMIPWLVLNRLSHGRLVLIPQALALPGYWTWRNFRGWDVLFGWEQGLFAYHPILLFGVGGWLLMLQRPALRPLALGLMGAFAAEWAINSLVDERRMEGGFGGRRFCGLVPAFALGYGELLRAVRRVRLARAILVAAAVWAVAANVLLLGARGAGLSGVGWWLDVINYPPILWAAAKAMWAARAEGWVMRLFDADAPGPAMLVLTAMVGWASMAVWAYRAPWPRWFTRRLAWVSYSTGMGLLTAAMALLAPQPDPLNSAFRALITDPRTPRRKRLFHLERLLHASLRNPAAAWWAQALDDDAPTTRALAQRLDAAAKISPDFARAWGSELWRAALASAVAGKSNHALLTTASIELPEQTELSRLSEAIAPRLRGAPEPLFPPTRESQLREMLEAVAESSGEVKALRFAWAHELATLRPDDAEACRTWARALHESGRRAESEVVLEAWNNWHGARRDTLGVLGR